MPTFTNPVHILHIGANDGKEIYEYLDQHSSTLQSVTFVECIPSVYERLCNRLRAVKEETKTNIELKAIKALCSDIPGEEVEFFIASNEGGSSSMLPPNSNEWVWNDVSFVSSIKLITSTVDTLVLKGVLSPQYDALVLDTQGTELRVLKGMTSMLSSVREIITEFSKREFYKGGVLLPDLTEYLMNQGFEIDEIPFSNHSDMKFVRTS